MRHASLRLLLIATTMLVAVPVAAQEVPPVVSPASDPVPTQPLIVVGEETDTPAPTIDAIPRVWAPVPRNAQGESAYGLYLSGRSALSRGESETAADFLTAVEALTPEQPAIQDQTFIATLIAGDLDVAARITPTAETVSPVITQAGALVTAVQRFVAGDARAANTGLKAAPIGAPHARAGALVAPWIAAAAGDWETALAEPNPTGDPVTVLFGRYHRALLLEHRRRYPEAETALKTLADGARTAPLFRIAYGEFLERRGRRDEALAFYDGVIAAGTEDPAVTRARARIVAGGRPAPLADYRAAAANALITASTQASVEGANEFAIVYLRLADNLKSDPQTRYLIGLALGQADMRRAARSVLAEVPDDSAPIYAAAQVQIGLSLVKDEQMEEALAAFLRAQEATPDDPRIAYMTAGQLLQLQRYEEAVALLDGPLLDTADQSSDVRFMRGAAYESLGRIPEAEAQLWAALQAQPNEPAYLNYLGYLWVDNGTRVAEGAEMIARAHAADPSDGNIQDSLGWAQFRQGQYDIAVETLEQAVAKEPANAEINDHLGDAYWQVGRRREAGFQWNRVLTLDPDAERRASVERKITQGLDL